MRRLVTALLVAAAIAAGCTSDQSGPSIADGGLPVYSLGAPDDVDTLPIAQALHDVLELPEDADVETRGQFEARIDGAGHNAVVIDRRAGPVQITYAGPRFGNPGCTECPPLDDTDDAATAIERSTEILDAIGIDTANIVFTEGTRNDVNYRLIGNVVVEGATIDDLSFNFVWTHGFELRDFSGSIFTIDTIGTVAPRPETDARTQAETMTGSDNDITDFELIYTGGFRDGELIVAPAYLATTELGTTFTVSAFTGPLPD